MFQSKSRITIAKNLFKLRFSFYSFKSNVNNCYAYSTFQKKENQLEFFVSKINSELIKNGTVASASLNNFLREINKTSNLDSKIALDALKFLRNSFIDRLPIQRQNLLDGLFFEILPKKEVNYEQIHYEEFMKSTLMNNQSFDPYKLTKQMFDNKIRINSKINEFLIKQLCQMNRIDLVIMHLNNIFMNESLDILVDLKNYEDTLIGDESSFNLLLKCLNITKMKILGPDLLNPLISCYMNQKQPDQAIELFEIFFKKKLEPNDRSYLNLIMGYLNMSELIKAKSLLEGPGFTPSEQSCFELFYKLSNLKTQNEHNATNQELLNQMIQFVLSKIDLNRAKNQNQRIIFVDTLYEACKRGQFNDVIELMDHIFHDELTIHDPRKLNELMSKIRVVDYFLMALVYYERNLEKILTFSSILDEKFKSNEINFHLKKCVYHLLDSKVDKNLSLKIIDYLHKNGTRININYFFPILVKAYSELNEEIEKQIKNGLECRVENLNEFKFIENLITGEMIKRYKLIIGMEEISTITDLLITKNQFYTTKQNLSFYHIATLLKSFDREIVLNTLLKKLVNLRIYGQDESTLKSKNLRHLNDRVNVDNVRYDFEDIYNIIDKYFVRSIDEKVVESFHLYLEIFLKTNSDACKNLFVDYENNIIFKTIRLLNRKFLEKNKRNDSIIILNKLLYNYIKNNLIVNQDSNQLQQLDEEFDKNFIKISTALDNNKESEVLGFRGRPTLDTNDQIKKIFDMKNADPRLLSHMTRRLILKLCNDFDNSRYMHILDDLEKLEKLLSVDEISPIVSETLMSFYAMVPQKFQKSAYYFDIFINDKRRQEKRDKSEYEANKLKLLAFIECSYRNGESVKEILKIFNKIDWPLSSRLDVNNSETFKTKLHDFLIQIYKNCNAESYFKLVEKMFSCNFIKRNVKTANFVMLKLIDSNKLDKALDYFKMNLIDHNLSIMEVVLFKRFLNNPLGDQSHHIKVLFELCRNYYDENLAYNSIFLGYYLAGNHQKAVQIFENNLNNQLDTEILAHLVEQMSSNKILSKHIFNIHNLPNFKPLANHPLLKKNVENVLNESLCKKSK